MEAVISDIALQNRANFHVVRLNGFVHTDDKLALREIWRQLGREMEVDDDIANRVGLMSPDIYELCVTNGHRQATTLIRWHPF